MSRKIYSYYWYHHGARFYKETHATCQKIDLALDTKNYALFCEGREELKKWFPEVSITEFLPNYIYVMEEGASWNSHIETIELNEENFKKINCYDCEHG